MVFQDSILPYYHVSVQIDPGTSESTDVFVVVKTYVFTEGLQLVPTFKN